MDKWRTEMLLRENVNLPYKKHVMVYPARVDTKRQRAEWRAELIQS